MKGRVADIAGRRFGFLSVLRRDGSIDHASAWLCRCVCGYECRVPAVRLLGGYTKSCGRGHYNRAWISIVAAEELRIWKGMLQRCYDRKTVSYKYYGKLGVRVCDRWRYSFENFLSDMRPRPSSKHSIDRYPDPCGNYELKNCRWATSKEQGRNKRKTVFVEWGGERLAITEMCEKLGIHREMLRKRLKLKWTIEEALTIPAKKGRFIERKRAGQT